MNAPVKPVRPVLFLPALAVVLMAQAPFCQENLNQWQHSKSIVINTTAADFGIATSQVHFPWLVRLTGKKFAFNQAQGNGGDIRFAKNDNTPLPFQINHWDSAGQSAGIWVLMDTIYGNNGTQSFKMFWGNPSAVPASNGAAVFEPGNGFAGVWHLEESAPGTGTAGVYKDATGNANNGKDNIAGDTVDEWIGRGAVFEVFKDQILVENPSAHLKPATHLSISFWARPVGLGAVVSQGRNYNALLRPSPMFYIITNGSVAYCSKDLETGQGWQLYTMQKTPAGSEIYHNGRLVEQCPIPTDIQYVGTNNLSIGTDGFNFDEYSFQGSVDELWISGVARSADWIRLAFLNQQGVEGPPVIRFPKNEVALEVNEPIDIVPATEGIVDSFTVSPALPDFLTLNATTGAISGWRESNLPRTVFMVKAFNRLGYGYDTVAITVTGGAVCNPRRHSRHSLELCGLSQNPVPAVSFFLPRSQTAGDVRFVLYNLKGTSLGTARACGATLSAGRHTVPLLLSGGLKAGTYFIEMRATGNSSEINVLRQKAVALR
jgi:hypothetical protein